MQLQHSIQIKPGHGFSYEIGHKNAAGEWEPDIICSDVFPTYFDAKTAATKQQIAAETALRNHRRMLVQRQFCRLFDKSA